MKSTIFKEIQNERDYQDKRFGKQPRSLKPTLYLAVLTEELGEVARAIIEGQSENYRAELIQLAAVAVAAIQEFDEGSATYDLDEVCPPIVYASQGQLNKATNTRKN
ncbi:hypothetical protein [Microcoleus sp. T3_D1]|uniref:hypothetical protein n=1 Tax=Microcoleus sp. T3_D1 TaxID=3055427 RepID=UPI002FD0EF0D